jgi:hypothetical protein
MLRNYTIYLICLGFFVCNTFFFSGITLATDSSVREEYYGIKTGKLDSTENKEAEKQRKYETPKEKVQAESEYVTTTLSGKVVETMNSGGYTYILLEKDGEKTWVAVREMEIAVGQEISFEPGHEMSNFTSNTLNRTFDRIVFSAGPVSRHGSSGSDKTMGLGSKGTVVHTDESIKEEKASGPNAYTVAELYEKGDKLDKSNVIIRGKVVKVSIGIMGKNWLHIQDGTGDEKNNTHDLVVTTQDKPSVGDVVTVSGTLYKDKDFGSGYRYDVIVEEAHVKIE